MPAFDWIALSRELKSIAEAGLRYGENAFDRERYQRILEIASLPMRMAAPDFQWPQEFGYATPKVDVRGAVFDEENRILLVREASNGLWTLPGGWADLNQSPSANVIKEMSEESGLIVEVVKLVSCWDKDLHEHPRQPEHVYKLLFLCRRTGGEPATNHETSGVAYFHPHELPDLCPHRSGRAYLDQAWEHHANPSLPTSFD
jgi:ADP-ribose pyrophosphatase YjhB (NUDIX family)